MALKLIRLKSGEELIANVKEIFSKENNERPLAYMFEDPCVVAIEQNRDFLTEEGENSTDVGARIIMRKWLPLTDDVDHMVPLDWVITFANPAQDVVDIYNNRKPQETVEEQNDTDTLTEE
jgi:hypothetical protein